MVDVCLPGTGGMIPLPHRWLSCCWIEWNGKAILIDCGEGTQIALRNASCKITRLHLLLLTHFHADHIAGLPGLLLTLGNCGKTSPLTIIGPPGLSSILTALRIIAPDLPFPLQIREFAPNTTRRLGEELEISSLSLSHSIPCLGYRIEIKRKPIFNPQKAQELKIPPIYYKDLHRGATISFRGQKITPNMVLDGERPPISICYCTDSHPINAIISFVKHADLFICEGMYGDDTLHSKIEEKGHMVFTDSAHLAKSAQVKQLWLTHYSAALQNPEEYLENARSIFASTETGFDGIRKSLP